MQSIIEETEKKPALLTRPHIHLSYTLFYGTDFLAGL